MGVELVGGVSGDVHGLFEGCVKEGKILDI